MSLAADFCDWLVQTRPSLVVQSVGWIIPTVQSIHILGVAVVMASVVMVALRLVGLTGRDQPIAAVARRFIPWIWSAVAVLLVTGGVLIVAEPRRDLLNAVFQTKMALLVGAALITAIIQAAVSRNMSGWGASSKKGARPAILAVVSLGLWTAILVCGRWIAYVNHG